MTRRQILKSLTAAALAVVAPVPTLAASRIGSGGKMAIPPARLVDSEAPCPCCCGHDDCLPYDVSFSFSGDPKTYRLTPQPDGSFKWTGFVVSPPIHPIKSIIFDADFSPLTP